MTGSSLHERYRRIAQAVEASPVQVIGFQEVFSYHHLHRLARYLPSFRHVAFRRSVAGPASGVVTFSRTPPGGQRRRRLASASIRTDGREVLFTGKAALPGGPGYLSDHVGLCATLGVPDNGRRDDCR